VIVALLILAGCVLIVAGVFLAVGLWAALIVSGACLLAGAWLTNQVLQANPESEGAR